MNNPILGHLIDVNAQRDCIHVAIAPVVAVEPLSPGQHVGFAVAGDTERVCHASNDIKSVGIVDPFLRVPVMKGERFYMMLYPGTIQGLRHDWIHPAFAVTASVAPPPPDKAASEKWLRDYAARVNTHYEDNPAKAFEVFMENVSQGEIFYHGSDLHGLYQLEDAEALFKHLSTYLGRRVDADSFHSYSCTC